MIHAATHRLLLFVVTALFLGMASATSAATAQPSPIQQMFLFGQLMPEVERIGIIRAQGSASEEEQQAVQVAVANTGASLFIVEIDRRRDLGPALRELTRTHDVQAVWVVKEDAIMGSDAARQYLIENTTRAGVALLAPKPTWVEEGALVTITDTGEGLGLLVNSAVQQALSINVPDGISENTRFASN